MIGPRFDVGAHCVKIHSVTGLPDLKEMLLQRACWHWLASVRVQQQTTHDLMVSHPLACPRSSLKGG